MVSFPAPATTLKSQPSGQAFFLPTINEAICRARLVFLDFQLEHPALQSEGEASSEGFVSLIR